MTKSTNKFVLRITLLSKHIILHVSEIKRYAKVKFD